MTSIFVRRVLMLLAALVLTTGATSVSAQTTVTGRLVTAIHDPAPGQGDPWVSYHIVTAAGATFDVEVDDALLARAGGLAQLRGRTVTISGSPAITRNPRESARSVIRAQTLASKPAGAFTTSAFNSGAIPFAVLLCRFAGQADKTPASPSEISAWIGSAQPGADNFWTETSNGNISLTGSQVYGWFNMSQPFDYYYGADVQSRFPSGIARDIALRDDCVNAADATVNFANFKGVVVQLNAEMQTSYAYLDGVPMTRDGVTRNFNTVYMADWAALISGPGVYAHEIGHTFGLEHSSGPYGATYDSKWDVMSYSYSNRFTSPLGYFGTHTIAYNKALLGWIPSNQRKSFVTGDVGTVVIARSGQPASSGILIADVPMLGEPSNKITIEARKRVGLYEAGIPFEGIVLHRIDPLRHNSTGRLATILDDDGNGDVNDEGGVLTVGEKFTDALSGVQVEVLSENAAGYTVRVTPGRMLTLTFSGGGSGTVVSDPSPGWPISCTSTNDVATGDCVRPFYTAQTLTLRATAAPGFRHAGWRGACNGAAGSVCKVSMLDAVAVTARFEPIGTVATELSITTQPRNAFSGKTFSISPIVQLIDVYGVPFPQAGAPIYAVVQSGEGVLSGTVPVLTDESGKAVFSNLKITGTGTHVLRFYSGVINAITSSPFTVTVAPVPLLSVSGTGFGVVSSSPAGINCVLAASVGSGTCTKTFADGTPVTVTVIASAGYTFTAWGGACTGIGACSFIMDTARTVTAAFSAIPIAIAATAEPANGGSVTGGGSFVYGNPVTMTAVATTGWHFVQWTEGATSVSTQPTYTFSATAARTLTAVFARTVHPLTVTATGSGKVVSAPAGIDCTFANGVGTGSCNGGYFNGTSVTLTATAASGFTMTGWGGACSTSAACAIQMPDAPTSVTAAFSANNVIVAVTGDGEARITSVPSGIDCTRRANTTSGTCETAVATGSEATLTALPSDGTLFVGWTGACTGYGVCKTKVNGVGATATVTAQFAAVPIILPALAASDLLGANTLSALQRTALDRWGNNDGTFDVGDLLAQLDRTHQKLSSSVMQDLLMHATPSAQSPGKRSPGGNQ